ncbi:hypothetical protein GCM10011348_14690 [Marinobacterium nitratireducens]|uniref:Proteophosphoglycan n=1 Tax=Marinobacterium nitratireducens TaxID=518897 RepID=A0A917ZAW0_9GAMM|nr:DUF1285 domain-containing protein [Marinobacterium nitratireducens]GGO79719.1 hypothetical protein GCM10011348_14690 [Marinobacterium nitratireducens]
MSQFDLGETQRQLEQHGDGIPPLERWNPDFCGDIDMRIARDGTWYYCGSPIGRKAMVRMFSRVLWPEAGSYFLKTPVEKVGIRVDDLPFQVVNLELREGPFGQELHFTTTTDDHIVAGPEHRIRVTQDPQTGEPAPEIEVRFGMSGRIHRNLFYQLVDMAATEPAAGGGDELVVYSLGERFSLGHL